MVCLLSMDDLAVDSDEEVDYSKMDQVCMHDTWSLSSVTTQSHYRAYNTKIIDLKFYFSIFLK